MGRKKAVKTVDVPYLVTDFGDFRIIKTDGMFFYCEDRKFLLTNPHIQRVEPRPVAVQTEAPAGK